MASNNGYSPLILKGIDDKIDALSLELREENLRISNRIEAVLGMLKTLKLLMIIQILLNIILLIITVLSFVSAPHTAGASSASSVANGVAVVKTG